MRDTMFCAALGCLFTLRAPAQDEASEPVFRSGTRLVEVSITATDSAGRPVRDLSREDFEILDDEERRAVSVFAPPPLDAPQARPGGSADLITISNRDNDRSLDPVTVVLIEIPLRHAEVVNLVWPVRELMRTLAKTQNPGRVAI